MKLLCGIISIVFVSGLFVACKHDIPVPQPDTTNNENGGNNGGVLNCDPNVVYFNQQVLPFLISNCAKSGCHDAITAEEGIIMTSYQSIMNADIVDPGRSDHSDMYEVITETDPDDIMPPPPHAPLTAQQIQLVANWIDQGAQNLSCNSGCDTSNVTWIGTVEPIIRTNCRGCHSGSTPDGGILLTTHQEVAAKAFSGELLGVVTHSPGFEPMPRGANQLDNCKLDQIRIWVNAGAPNN